MKVNFKSALTPRSFERWNRKVGCGSRLEIQALQGARYGVAMLQYINRIYSPSLDNADNFLEKRISWLQKGSDKLSAGSNRSILKEKYRILFEQAPIGFHNITASGTIVDVNQKWLADLGYSKEEVVGRPIFDFIVPEQRENAQKRFDARINRGPMPSPNGERHYIHKDGSRRVGRTYSSVVRNQEGKALFIQTSFEDMTAYLELEREHLRVRIQQGEMEAATSSINGLVHALSQKFTALIGLSSLLLMKPKDEKFNAELQKVISDIKNYFGMYDIFRFGIEKAMRFDLKHMVESAVKKVEERFSALSPETNLCIYDDLEKCSLPYTAFSLILEAVLRNAYQALRKNGEVSLTFRKTLRKGREGLLMTVSDNGRGMTPEVQEKMFRPFYSTDPDATPLQKGLSLAVVQNAVFQLGGAIDVESIVDKGTTFRLWLPLAE